MSGTSHGIRNGATCLSCARCIAIGAARWERALLSVSTRARCHSYTDLFKLLSLDVGRSGLLIFQDRCSIAHTAFPGLVASVLVGLRLHRWYARWVRWCPPVVL